MLAKELQLHLYFRCTRDTSPTSSSVKNRSIWPAVQEICWTTEPSWWRRCCWWIDHMPEKRWTNHVRIRPENYKVTVKSSDILTCLVSCRQMSTSQRDYWPCRVLPRSQRRCWRQTWPRRCTSYGRPGWSGRTLWGPGRNTNIFGSITMYLYYSHLPT